MQPIAAYELPRLRPDGPGDRWRVEPRNAALLVHDMQDYFVKAFEPPLRTALVDGVAGAVDWARRAKIPVMYTAQPGSMSTDERGLLSDFWGAGMDRRAGDTSIVDRVRPDGSEPVFTKWRYSAFVGNGLEWALRRQGIHDLVIAGVYASVGILTTALDAFNRDIRPFVLSDCVADFDAEGHAAALDHVARYSGRVLTLNELSASAA
ncbi:isochorismate hydrolase [Kitasatospora sp. SolWspMP-SS2h]|uniref:isochorismatase family protein n=1 Tax=Kitasatospora sp. SolWspMP-SS2h TaxID=1305729 RepID=UPI000DB975D2|nr:isochorismatase family protein [Kitasatospora sp. SolWspMP-SS2h]RAJ43065.1 isochorismate hydrolase [Kitasatospora sp. SolWspMP-SS2h]